MTVRITTNDDHGVHVESFMGVENVQYETCGNGNFFQLKWDGKEPYTFLASEGDKIEIAA